MTSPPIPPAASHWVVSTQIGPRWHFCCRGSKNGPPIQIGDETTHGLVAFFGAITVGQVTSRLPAQVVVATWYRVLPI